MTRRGLTLVEVIAAAVLLAAMAATCVPLLQSAMRAGAPESPAGVPSVSRSDLEEFATQVATAPSSFGIDPTFEGPWSIPWPDRPELPLISVTRLESRSGPDDAVWLAFRCRELVALRWIRVVVDPGKRPRSAGRVP